MERYGRSLTVLNGHSNRQDYELLHSLSDFVAIVLRQQAADAKDKVAGKAEASAARAHEMAPQINNPLQSLTNTMFLAHEGGPDSQVYIEQALTELTALSEQVKANSLRLSSPKDECHVPI